MIVRAFSLYFLGFTVPVYTFCGASRRALLTALDGIGGVVGRGRTTFLMDLGCRAGTFPIHGF